MSVRPSCIAKENARRNPGVSCIRDALFLIGEVYGPEGLYPAVPFKQERPGPTFTRPISGSDQ